MTVPPRADASGRDDSAGVRPGLETTASLLDRARLGDRGAMDLLAGRYLVVLRRWAHGRLPPRARHLLDTEDLVQISVVRALDHVKDFEPRYEGAFLMYLRQIVMNQIRDEVRRASRQPLTEGLAETMQHEGPSPLEEAIGSEALEAYEAGLARLTGKQHDAVVLRLEMGYTHQEVAEALTLPSANAARMLVARALVTLAEVMDGRS